MKGKIVLFIIIGIFLLGLVGWVSYSKFKGNKTVSTGSNSEKSGIFTSVKDALTQKLTLSCEFTDETGTVVKSYIKNGAVRVSSIGNGDNVQANEIIIKDKKMYMWDSKTKEGFVYSINEENGNSEAVKSDSYFEAIDKYKDSCKIATVMDSYFTIPTDVNFQDMSKLLEDLQKYGNSK